MGSFHHEAGWARRQRSWSSGDLGREEDGAAVKRVYRIMKAHGLLLQWRAGQDRLHFGTVATGCSDGFEISCDTSLLPGRARPDKTIYDLRS